MCRLKYFLLSLVMVTQTNVLKAQSYGTVGQWESKVEQRFDEIVGLENTGLLKGIEYKFPVRGSTTHPFLVSQGGGLATIQFTNEDLYYNVPLIIDLYQQQIAIRYLKRTGQIALIQIDESKVKSLSIFGRQFERFLHEGKEDLFEILFQKDDCFLVAKRRKVIEVESLSKVEFGDEDQFFWIEKGKWNALKSSSDYDALATAKGIAKEFKQFVKLQGIKIRKRNEADIRKIASFYCGQR